MKNSVLFFLSPRCQPQLAYQMKCTHAPKQLCEHSDYTHYRSGLMNSHAIKSYQLACYQAYEVFSTPAKQARKRILSNLFNPCEASAQTHKHILSRLRPTLMKRACTHAGHLLATISSPAAVRSLTLHHVLERVDLLEHRACEFRLLIHHADRHNERIFSGQNASLCDRKQ